MSGAGRSPGARLVRAGVAVEVAMAVVAVVVFEAGSSGGGDSRLAGAALCALVAAPAVLARCGLDGRPALLVAAGIVLVPMCFLSFSFLFFPLVVPAVLFLAAAVAVRRSPLRPRLQPVVAFLALVFVIAAGLSLFAHRDPFEAHTAAGGSPYSSDVVTDQEALTSLGFVLAAVIVAALAPRDGVASRARP